MPAFPFPSPSLCPFLHETEAGRRGGQRNFPNPTHLLGGVGEPPSAFHSAVRSIRNLQRARCRGLGRTERRRVGFTSSLSSLTPASSSPLRPWPPLPSVAAAADDFVAKSPPCVIDDLYFFALAHLECTAVDRRRRRRQEEKAEFGKTPNQILKF